MNTNLAYAYRPGETEMAPRQAGETHTPAVQAREPRTDTRRRKYKPVSFRDNHSDLFRPFRIY